MERNNFLLPPLQKSCLINENVKDDELQRDITRNLKAHEVESKTYMRGSEL